MVRKVVAHKHLQDYLLAQAKSKSPCTVGLIIGQPCDDKDYLLHFAKTSANAGEDQQDCNVNTLSQFPELAIIEHAKQTTRMLSGGLYVVGIFVVSDEQVLQPFHKKLVTILQSLHNELANGPLLYGNWSSNSERLVLHFSGQTRQCSVKSYNVQNGRNDAVNCAFSEKEPLWCPLECKFDVTEAVPISQGQQTTSLKTQMKTLVSNLGHQLKNATFIFDGKVRNLQDSIEFNHPAKRKSINVINTPKEEKCIDVSILLPMTTKYGSHTELTDTAGTLRVNGQICSTVWLNPSCTFAVAKSAITEDIIRSFQARLSMHFDSLTEGESGIFNDSLHEPPRRVTITLPSSNISLSDYLFPGEGPEEAQHSFQDVLDISVKSKHVIQDSEGQADLSNYCSESGSRESPDLPMPTLTMGGFRKLYFLGTAAVTCLVLLVALVIQFFRQ